jgi:hypothetical protein
MPHRSWRRSASHGSGREGARRGHERGREGARATVGGEGVRAGTEGGGILRSRGHGRELLHARGTPPPPWAPACECWSRRERDEKRSRGMKRTVFYVTSGGLVIFLPKSR